MSTIFVIRPVRNITPDFQESVDNQIEEFKELGYTVYDPQVDTDQDDVNGYRICMDNLGAIQHADYVCFMWDGKSQGCLFDLGMAFALDKPMLCIPKLMPPMTEGKSFQNMAYAWSLFSEEEEQRIEEQNRHDWQREQSWYELSREE